ncbi:hypothetical protein AB0F42_05080 [Streptomyces buecherae]|uniref:hypothetical protein n=1 Tax=Streptomyces buecherae TaxID=2763006 RepID=UPI0034027D28
MIFLVPVVLLAACAVVVFLVLQCLRAALPGGGRWTGWRRAAAAAAFACAATATAAYALGAVTLMLTVSAAQDGGADSAPFPYDHPCRAQLTGAVDYEVDFLTLRTVCVLADGERRAVRDVPRAVRTVAATSAVCAGALAGAVWAPGRTRAPAAVR